MLRTFLALCLLAATAEAAMPAKKRRLAAEKSPYLSSHAANPVDWYPWGEAAFAQARQQGRPIFLSIGYASCHWCHVMERESFMNSGIAELLNSRFVPVLVDREEHPDVDATYIAFIQATTGSSGWPANLILTPDLTPITGTTYLRTEALRTLLENISARWAADRNAVLASSEQLVQMTRALAAPPASESGALDAAILEQTFAQISTLFDPANGGFGTSPKFPLPATIDFLLRHAQRTGSTAARRMASDTLHGLARGGIHDQLGGGFHRYTVDTEWRVPHFEKMLYDQAQLAMAYTHAWQLTGDRAFADVARATLDYALRELLEEGGAFASSQDADSIVEGHKEPVEGLYYLWDAAALRTLLGPRHAEIVAYHYGFDAEGNIPEESDVEGHFKGRNIPYVARTAQDTRAQFELDEQQWNEIITAAKQKMLDARARRPKPERDEKVLVSWNGLMISALARAGAVFEEPGYREAATRAAEFIRARLWNAKEKKLHRRYAAGAAGIDALAEDYALLIQGLLDLYESTFDVRWLQWAVELQERQEQLFGAGGKGRYVTGGTAPAALAGIVSESDAPLPSANSVSAMNLLRLASMTANDRWRTRALEVIRAAGADLQARPAELPMLASAFAMTLSKPKQIIIAGEPDATDTRALLGVVHEQFLPNRVLLLASAAAKPWLQRQLPSVETMNPLRGRATAFVCEDYVCKLPTNDPEMLRKQLHQ